MVIMKRKLFSLAMAAVLMLTVNVSAFAAEKPGQALGRGYAQAAADSDFHVMYTNTEEIAADLIFYGTRANCAGVVDGNPGTTKIVATGLLKRVNSNGTTTVKSWTKTVYAESLYFEQDFYVASGYDYDFELTAKVYRNGTVETVSFTDTEYCAG
jgi:hypothetical protein